MYAKGKIYYWQELKIERIYDAVSNISVSLTIVVVSCPSSLEETQALLKDLYSKTWKFSFSFHKNPCTPEINIIFYDDSNDSYDWIFNKPPTTIHFMNPSFSSSKSVILGGTFDHLHPGHKVLLTIASLVGTKLTVGLSTDQLLERKKFKKFIETSSVRKNNVEKFLKLVNPQNFKNLSLVEISDVYGPSIVEKTFEAIVVSNESLSGGLEVNRKRQELGMNPLEMIIVDLVSQFKEPIDEEFNGKLSSTFIRQWLELNKSNNNNN